MTGFKKTRAMLIGEVSRLSGVHVETIRYYERTGIVHQPPRNIGGRRIYDRALLNRLKFVRRCRELGFGLNDISGLLALVDADGATCAEVYSVVSHHLREVRQKITDLRRIQKVLTAMAAECSRDIVPDCPIIDALTEAA